MLCCILDSKNICYAKFFCCVLVLLFDSFQVKKVITKHVHTFHAYKSTTPFMCMTEAQLLCISGRWCNCSRSFFSWNDAFAVSSCISTRKNLWFSRIHPLTAIIKHAFETFSIQVFQLDTTQLNATITFYLFALFFNKLIHYDPVWSFMILYDPIVIHFNKIRRSQKVLICQ